MTDRARIKRIRSFREEIDLLQSEGIVSDEAPTLRAIAERHAAIIDAAADDETIDLNREQERLSAGMRLATLLGSAALSIAWVMFVSSLWDDLGRVPKLLIIWFPPVLLAVATGVAARREKSGYVANIFSTVGAISLAVAAIATWEIYQWQPSRIPFLIVGLYALVLAYKHKLVLPLLIGGVGVGGWLWSLASMLRGEQFDYAFAYAEPAIVLGAVGIAIGTVRKKDPPEFRFLWRLAGVVAVCWSLLILGVAGETSWFGPGNGVEGLYQVLGAFVFVGIVWYGLKTDDVVLSRVGGTALVLYLLFRMSDWFWGVIPDWLFFLFIGILAFGVLLGLRQIRQRTR